MKTESEKTGKRPKKMGSKPETNGTSPLISQHSGLINSDRIQEGIQTPEEIEKSIKDLNFLLVEAQKIASLGTYVLDFKTGQWRSSAYLREIFDLPEGYVQDIPGWLQIIHPEDREMMQAYLSESIVAHHEAFNKEYRIERILDKKVRWINGLGKLEFDNEGNLSRMIGTVQDITEQREIQQRFLKKHYYLTKAQELGKIGTWEIDLHDNSIVWTEENYKIFGIPPDSPVTFEIFLECAHPDDRERINNEWLGALKGEPYDIEHRILQNGEVKWVREKADINYDAQGKPFLAIGFTQDITDRKAAEDALRATMAREQELADIVRSTPVAIAFGFPDGNLANSNPAFSELTGYSEEELKKVKWNDALTPQKWIKNELEQLSRLTPEDNSIRYEKEYRRKDGVVIPVELIVYASYNTEGKVHHYTGFVYDISDRKRVEKDLIKAKEKAEESDRLKSAFLANMSHEIRTPMNGILGFAELLKKSQLSGEEQQSYIKIIEQSGARMLNIINNLIDISKVESGLIDIILTQTPVMEPVDYVCALFKPEADKKRVALTPLLPKSNQEATVQTDKEKLYAILTNLTKNAIKYCDKGTVEVGYTVGKNEVEYFVRDTGIGIPEGRKGAIFDRFVQADISDKRAYQGAGLGLAISKAYVEKLGGRIWVDSLEGVGSTFYFTIPLIGTATENEPSAKLLSGAILPGGRQLNILVVEDDSASEIFITAATKKISRKTLKSSSGKEAVDICRENPDLDLVLMDIKMSGMDGLEATRAIREFNKTVIIIAQTAFGMESDRAKALEAGCNDYISKPFNSTQLNNLISKYFK